MKSKLSPGTPILGFAILATSAIAACSGGGGGSSPAPAPLASPALGGIGPDVSFDQKVNFTVIVPPATTTSAVAAARRKRLGSVSDSASNPYISPNIASLTLQVGTVDGQSPRLLPPLQTFAVSCPGTGGCSVPIQNIAAAKGVDRFAVQTFSGPGATGNLISSSFIDVTVPSAQATSFGGTALSVGGFVQSISLALNIPGGSFEYDTPATGTVDVNAVDPAGAIIIGSDQLASAITVSLPDANDGAFTLNTVQQVALTQPAQTLTLAYNGTILLRGMVTASTTDENSQPVSTSLPIPIKATPVPPTPVPPSPKPKPTLPPGVKPSPTPIPTPKSALSLYVYDGTGDRIIEYGGITDFEGGQAFNTTPRRIFEVAAPAALNANLQNCASQSALAPIVASMAVSSTGTIYAQTSCTDAATSTLGYVFTYSAATQEVVPSGPQPSPTPPAPNATFSINLGSFPAPVDIKLDEPNRLLYSAYQNANFTAPEVIGMPISGAGNETANFGSTCLQEIGFPASCVANPTNSYAGTSTNIALDGNGNIYIPTSYQTPDLNGNPVIPPGLSTQVFPGEPTVALFAPNQSNPAPNPVSAFAGFADELGEVQAPSYVATEGSTLYALVNGVSSAGLTDPRDNVSTVFPGLSGCPPPSASATPDTATNLCADSNAHNYLVGFTNAPQTLTASGNAGANVLQAPTLMVGGDAVGNFPSYVYGTSGNPLVVKDGYAYILNPAPVSGGNPEIDVYNLNGITGVHTDLAPQTKIPLDPSISVTTIAVGVTGSGTGGQALLRRPSRVHHDVKAWRRELQRRQALRNAMRRR